MHQRAGDLEVNACRKKAATNIRSANKEQTVVLNESFKPGLDDALEYIIDSEVVEVRPKLQTLNRKLEIVGQCVLPVTNCRSITAKS